MDVGAKKLLESVTYETLHAHNFSRSSSQASQVLTDLLSRYLTLLTTSCAKYAEHAGRLSLSIRDAVSALDELGVGVDELNEYCATEGKDISRYAVHTAKRVEDLTEFKASLAVGLREDRDDAIPLVYARVPSPMIEEDEDEVSAGEEEEEEVEEAVQHESMDSGMDVDIIQKDSAWLKDRNEPTSMQPPASPPLPLSPISNPSTPPRKRPRTASWRPPPHIPDHLPPFPTNSPRQSPSPPPTVPEAVKLERPLTPPPPQIAASPTSADYLTPVPYSQSSLSFTSTSHLPTPPPFSAGVTPTRSPVPQVQPALLGAYHHVLTHPPPPNVTTVNPARHKVALAFLAQAEAQPRWDPAPTLFSNTAPNPPRVAAIGPSFPLPISSLPPSPTEGKTGKDTDMDKDRKPVLPSAPPRPVVSLERVTPLLSQQTSRIPSLARQVLPGSVYTRTTRLTHPPVLHRGTQKLTYGTGINAQWNTNASVPTAGTGKTKDGGANGLSNGKDADAPVKPLLPDARLYATWDYEQKRFHEPLPVRRGRMGSLQTPVTVAPVRGRSESRMS